MSMSSLSLKQVSLNTIIPIEKHYLVFVLDNWFVGAFLTDITGEVFFVTSTSKFPAKWLKEIYVLEK